MEENKSNKPTTTEADSGRKKADEKPAKGNGNFRPLSEIDQDERNMNNGALGGNLGEGAKDEKKDR